jgi:predicted alpha/beta-fold hydrolase
MLIDLPPFRPHPLVRGGHLQTIVGSYLPSPTSNGAALHRVPLPDGDAIALHDDGGLSDHAVVILVHGLAGSHQSGYVVRSSTKLRAVGVRVFRMDLRGCGAGMALARHPLHAGRSEDLAAVIDYVHRACPGGSIHVVGFSMGANIALKLAGEQGAAARFASVMAVSPPIDLAMCTRHIARGFSRVYDRRFVSSLVEHVRQRITLVPDALSRPLTPHPRRLVDFDSLFTAPLSGFADVHDYYSRASSAIVLSKIAVPTLIVTATSDPIVPVDSFERAKYSPTTQLVLAPCGGHLGFVAARGTDADRRWIDWRVVEWVQSCSANTQLK